MSVRRSIVPPFCVTNLIAQATPSAVMIGAAISVRFAKGGPPMYKWGPKLPQSEWPRVEEAWLRKIVRPRALERIKADHSFYACDYNRFRFKRCPGPDRQRPDEDWLRYDKCWG